MAAQPFLLSAASEDLFLSLPIAWTENFRSLYDMRGFYYYFLTITWPSISLPRTCIHLSWRIELSAKLIHANTYFPVISPFLHKSFLFLCVHSIAFSFYQSPRTISSLSLLLHIPPPALTPPSRCRRAALRPAQRPRPRGLRPRRRLRPLPRAARVAARRLPRGREAFLLNGCQTVFGISVFGARAYL